MLKYMYKKNPVLMKIMIVIIFIILVWGVILIIDSIQKANLKRTEYRVPFPKSKQEPIIYDVDGLSDDAIDELIGGEQ